MKQIENNKDFFCFSTESFDPLGMPCHKKTHKLFAPSLENECMTSELENSFKNIPVQKTSEYVVYA